MKDLQQLRRMTSREIAELTNKEHRNVLRDISKLNETYNSMGLPKIEQGYYTHDKTGTQKHREFHLTKIQVLDLMTGYNSLLRIKVVRRWEELERGAVLPRKSFSEALRLEGERQLALEASAMKRRW